MQAVITLLVTVGSGLLLWVQSLDDPVMEWGVRCNNWIYDRLSRFHDGLTARYGRKSRPVRNASTSSDDD
ncbi:MAG: hypothetical protein HQL50_08580 [Magnetococcales bacterium]|nr:hypothetical protein [Magnetococcales bacterium]